MNKPIYLVSMALMIVGIALSTLTGPRYILSPTPVFQYGSLLNLIVMWACSLLLVVAFGRRFLDVARGRVDISTLVGTGFARFLQRSGIVLLAAGYALFIGAAALYAATPEGRSEILFLARGAVQLLPTGLVLFELGRLIGRDVTDAA